METKVNLVTFDIHKDILYTITMRILTVENQAFELDNIPDEVDDLRFCVLDNSNPKNPDFYYMPLVFMESFNSPALACKIGESIIKIPVSPPMSKEWQILIGEPDLGDLETITVTSVNDRGFKAFVTNPMSNFKPTFMDIEIVDVYQDVKWFFPKLKNNHLLAVPLTLGPKPQCIFIIKEISRQCEIVDISKVW